MRKNASPVSMNDGEIVVAVTNDTAKSIIESEKSFLSEISGKLSGIPKHIVVADNSDTSSEERDINTLASQVEDLLGIDVKIE